MNILSRLLPVFQRRSRRFEETFGVALGQVLDAIADAEDDPVAGQPRIALDLESVGYTRRGLLIQIDDPFGSGRAVHAVAAVKMGTRVPAERRGLHMSRIGDALARSVMEPHPHLTAYARALARAVRRTQYGAATAVEVRASIPYVEDVAIDRRPNVKASLEQLRLIARVALPGSDEGAEAIDSGIRFSHMVACPCVQKVWGHTRAAARGRGAASAPFDADPGFTHSQRCETTVIARGVREPLAVPALLEQLDAVVVRTMNTLPRGAELSMVHDAHRTPQFIEDALREALWAVYRTLGGAPFTSVTGRSASAESIHEFDLRAAGTLTPEEARRCAGPIAPIEASGRE